MLLPSRILRDVSATGCAHVMLIYDEPLLSQAEPTPIKRPLSSTLSGLYTVFEHLCTLPDEEWNTKRSTFNWDWRSAASHSETSPKSLFKGARRMVINEISLSWMLCLFNMKKITTARSYEKCLLTLSRPFKQNYRLPLPSHTFTYETLLTLLYAWSLKNVPFWAETARRDRRREYPRVFVCGFAIPVLKVLLWDMLKHSLTKAVKFIVVNCSVMIQWIKVRRIIRIYIYKLSFIEK